MPENMRAQNQNRQTPGQPSQGQGYSQNYGQKQGTTFASQKSSTKEFMCQSCGVGFETNDKLQQHDSTEHVPVRRE